MAEAIKVSEMSEATNINNEDIIMIIQNGENKKAQISKINENLENYVNAQIQNKITEVLEASY